MVWGVDGDLELLQLSSCHEGAYAEPKKRRDEPEPGLAYAWNPRLPGIHALLNFPLYLLVMPLLFKYV